MDLQIIAIYFFSDEILKSLRFYDDPQTKMTNAEIVSLAIIAALFFKGNQRQASIFLKQYRYISNILSEGHLNWRLHRIPCEIWQGIFSALAEHFKSINLSNEYAVDSFPIPVCDNIRIFRSKLFRGKQFRGYIASKKRFFFGIKAHILVTARGDVIECLFAPGSTSDLSIFKNFQLDLPAHATIYADKAYTCYDLEDFLNENKISLVAQRKANSKRPLIGCIRYIQSRIRKRIETTFSQITSLFPRYIHAITSKGFMLKVYLFILAYSISLLFKKS
jgi:hypothetical protein